MTQIWFTADTHFGHRRIPLYAKRRFCLTEEENALLDQAWRDGGDQPLRGRDAWQPSLAAIERMDRYLIDRINEVVQPEDVLWHLGDFCFGPSGPAMLACAQAYRDRIRCRTVHFTWGNHDDRRIAPLFNSHHERYELLWNGQLIVLSHYAHAVWNKSHRGAWMLYGHSHASAESWLDAHMPGRRSIDVGVDNAYRVLGESRPFSFDELHDLLNARPGYSIDHHVEKPCQETAG